MKIVLNNGERQFERISPKDCPVGRFFRNIDVVGDKPDIYLRVTDMLGDPAFLRVAGRGRIPYVVGSSNWAKSNCCELLPEGYSVTMTS